MFAHHHGLEFVVMPVANTRGASEFRQSMTPHPLVYQELPHEPHFGIYNSRLRSVSYAREDMVSYLPKFVGQMPSACWIAFLPAALQRFG